MIIEEKTEEIETDGPVFFVGWGLFGGKRDQEKMEDLYHYCAWGLLIAIAIGGMMIYHRISLLKRLNALKDARHETNQRVG